MQEMVDIVYTHPNGRRQRVRRSSPVQSRRGAEAYERQVRQELLAGTYGKEEVKIPTFAEWWEERFWSEWVEGRRNKPSEQESKQSSYKCHLGPAFGHMPLDQIDEGRIARFRAGLAKKKLTDKRINNILAPLSKALRYAEQVRVIERAPRVGMLRVERQPIKWWEVEEYARLVEAAKLEGSFWHVAVCLAGEAGLRIGEIRALVWERDLDLIAGTLTVSRQVRKGIEGTPKGRAERKVPMTGTLLAALKGLSVVRSGHVVRNEDGSQLRDGQTTHATYRICRRAGLPECGWHILRHTYGTHAAQFGINPWRLMAWMGHKSITETMRYVHVAEMHGRPLGVQLLGAGEGEMDPDRRVLAMLGARSAAGLRHNSGTTENAGS
jgi:integrase